MNLSDCDVKISYGKEFKKEISTVFDHNDTFYDYRDVIWGLNQLKNLGFELEFDFDHECITLIDENGDEGDIFIKIVPTYDTYSEVWGELEKEIK